MAFCTQCGAPVDGRFCANCGAPAEATGLSADKATEASTPKMDLTENVACLLCYAGFFVTGIAFIALAPYNQNRNVRFHAFQSIFYSVAWFIAGVFLSIIGMIMPLLAFIGPPIFFGFLLLWAFVMWKAYRNQKIVLPIIGPLAEKQV